MAMKKKFSLILLLWASGTTIAFVTSASLGEYTAFATLLGSLFAAADVADKKLNGGNY